MRILLAALFASTALLRCAGGTIDFTPTRGERVLEGLIFPQILFHQDGRIISYEQPRGWTYTGDASQLKLTPPKISQAQASIEQGALPAPQSFDEAMTKQLQQIVLASLPSGAQNMQIVAEERNPVRISQQETYEVTASYNYFGQDYQVSVLFANLDTTQLRFRLVARKVDFDTLHRAFRGSLFSLHWSS